ncbi:MULTISPECIES: hypothetical protein [unclassified Methylobacterium]|uniref:hypothetical protein n=1 Tax=unclassified Methylobacterium TaxID=2615210 RepID=UPI0036F5491F
MSPKQQADDDVDQRAARIAKNFALMIEGACQEFEALQAILSHEVTIAGTTPSAVFVQGTIVRSLTKTFLFNAARAYRIYKHGKSVLKLPRELRKEFEQVLEPVIAVRDVNEHGFDSHQIPGKKNLRPTLHLHAEFDAAVDETSIIALGPEQVLVGPLNIYNLYQTIARMRTVAGFAALRAASDKLPPTGHS